MANRVPAIQCTQVPLMPRFTRGRQRKSRVAVTGCGTRPPATGQGAGQDRGTRLFPSLEEVHDAARRPAHSILELGVRLANAIGQERHDDGARA